MKRDIFKNLSNQDLEKLLFDCNLEFEKVETGKGGVFIGPDQINIRDLDRQKNNVNVEEIAKTLSKNIDKYTTVNTVDYSDKGRNGFEETDDGYLSMAA